MSDSLKDKLQDAGNKISETATKVGHAVSEKAEEAKDWAKETAHKVGNRAEEAGQKVEHAVGGAVSGATNIKEHQDVVASCGTKVGRVDHVEGTNIRLTKTDSPDGVHHLIPLTWVASVDDKVHLNKDHVAVQSGWQSA